MKPSRAPLYLVAKSGRATSRRETRANGSSRLQRQQMAGAFEQAAIGMALLGTDHQCQQVNQAFCDMLGYSREELLARGAADVSSAHDVEQDLRLRQRMLAGELETYQREKRYLHKSGRMLWGHFTCSLMYDEDGQPAYFITQAQDITERKMAEEALRESEERFRSLAMLSSDWYWEQDAQWRYTAFSGRDVLRPWRAVQHQAIGRRLWELEGIDLSDPAWRDHQGVLAAHKPFRDFEYERRIDGECHYFSVSGEPVFDAAGAFVGYRGTARDITHDRLSEQRLHQARAMLHVAAQIGRLGAWAYDNGAGRMTWSEEVCAMHDVRPGLSPVLEQVLGFYAPEWRSAVRTTFERCLQDGTPFDVEAQVITAKGRKIWVRTIGEAVWDADGQVRSVHGACQDISEGKETAERLNAELEARVQQRTAQLELANKELQSFSYSIAHDLRAPLGAIDGFSQVLEQNVGATLDDKSRHYLRRIRRGVRQMAELTDGLLALANLSRASLRSEAVDLAVMAEVAAAACRERQPKRRVELNVRGPLHALGDARLLTQVMGNLIANAWKFTATAPQACIEVGSMHDRMRGTVYYVRDNGAGFDMAHAARMFEAFQRMHSASEFEGTGIGLAIVHKIVTRHGGTIWAQSAPQQGAAFFFTLPAPPVSTQD
jgi:PAS domain S-box-containing protein